MVEYVSEPDLETAKLFADETRRSLLDILAEEEMTNSQLAKKLGLSKATITYHIKQLEKAELITVDRVEYEKHGIPMKYYKLKVHLVSMPQGAKTDASAAVKGRFKGRLAELLKNGGKHLDREINPVLHQIMKASTALPAEDVDGLLYSLGYELGKEVMSEEVKGEELEDVLRGLARYWARTHLGEIEVVEKDEKVVLRVGECFDCVSMPDIGKNLCFFDAGIIAGTLERRLMKKYSVREVKCWGTGYEYCEFEIKAA